MRLEATVRGGGSPRDKAKIYVCVAKKERGLLSALKEWIWKSHDAALWTNTDDAPTLPEERQQLSEMRLFLLPVTHRALLDEEVLLDVAYAKEKRIPILPIFMEEGLEEDFNRAFGNLQALSPYAKDLTAISFEEKLGKYLSSVLVSDETAQKIRQAFDAYIFLSYRKKDRALAQKLMRLIHENDFARDIAIWYDEFLVPGEDWSEAIAAALHKSRLFALAVTPNLLEEGNFVQAVEYPAALHAGKPIVAAEVEATDREALGRRFSGLPPVVKAESSALPEALLRALSGIAVRENDSDPVHNFFIGLAYLSGIDVERDPARALSLITASAESEVPEAMEKLSEMYQNGDGVARDYGASALWMEKLAELYRRQWEKERTEENYEALFSALEEAGGKRMELGDLRAAQRLGDGMRDLAEAAVSVFPQAERDLAYAHSFLGCAAQELGDLEEADACFYKYYVGISALVAKRETRSLRRELSDCYCRLGDLAQQRFDHTAATEWFEKYYALAKELAEEKGTALARRELMVACNRLGDVLQYDDTDRCEALYRTAYEAALSIAEGSEDATARRDLSVSYERMGDVAMAHEKWAEAREWYQKAYEISEELVREYGTVRVRRDLAIHSGQIARTWEEEEAFDEAKAWYRKGYVTASALAEETAFAECRREASVLRRDLDGIERRRELAQYLESEEFLRSIEEAVERAARENGEA